MPGVSVSAKAKFIVLAFVPYLIVYVLIQQLITVNEYDLMTALDRQIPFMPEFIWIYHTIIPLTVFTCFLFFQKRRLFLLMTYSNLVAGTILCLFYVFFPSFYPRAEWVDTSTVSGMMVEFTRIIDGANNTFPSGHVTFAWMLALFVSISTLGKKHLWLRVAYFIWASLISISTLTLKQHYLFDVVSGIMLAGVIFYIFKRSRLFRETGSLINTDAKLIPTGTSSGGMPVNS
jgi:membrane-associated phospholipid phosphatase